MTHKEQGKLLEQKFDRIVLWLFASYNLDKKCPKKEFDCWATEFLALKRYSEKEIRDILEWKNMFYKEV